MVGALLLLAAFAFGVGVSVAQTRCLQAITAQHRPKAAFWDLVINGLSLVIIYEHSLPAFVAFAFGSAVGTYFSIDKTSVEG